MFKILTNAWKVKDIRTKMLFVFLLLLIYRLGSHIPLPGINPHQLLAMRGINTQDMSGTNLFALIAGGGYGTIFAMGIAPYITASIIMQLLTVAIPYLEQIQKEGEEGRKKINQYTRVLAVALSFLQGGSTIYSYCYTQAGNLFTVAATDASKFGRIFVYFTATVAIVTGTIFIMWLSELLTEKGIGNGSSFIIFANILSGLPTGIYSLYFQATGGGNLLLGVLKVVAVLILFAGVIAFVVLVQDGERRLPVQYSRKMVGKQMYGNQSSYIPIKVNIAGVMSIIFAISLLQFPQMIAQFWSPVWLTTLVDVLSIYRPVGAVLYIILIFCFTFFYTSFAVNPNEMAENMKKGGGFIPGIRPGKPTSEHIQKTVDRLSWIGAFFYALIALIPILFQSVLGVSVGFGGTTLLILTGVALEFIKQLESQLLMRHYKGFLS